jgi:hypothetical protein
MLLSFRPDIPLISNVRRLAGDLMDSVILDPDASSRVALTVHELLENTLKYSTDGLAEVTLRVTQGQDGKRKVEVRASNRATPEQSAELARRIDVLLGASNPMEVYLALMRESALRDGSGLGLARIRVEGEMQLSLTLDGDQVTISATTQVE